MEKIDNLDLHILGVITENARSSFQGRCSCLWSFQSCHSPTRTASHRSWYYRWSGYNVNPKAIGYSTCTYVGIRLERGSMYRDVATKLDKIPEIVECHFTTGNYTMLVKLYSHDNEHLMELLNHKIQEIPGVISTETLISLEQTINREIPIPTIKHCGEETSQASHSPQENRSCGYGRHRLNKGLCT